MTCLEIKKILKKHNVTGYSKLCKQELVNLVKKTLNNKKVKKGGRKYSKNDMLKVIRSLDLTNNKILSTTIEKMISLKKNSSEFTPLKI